MAETGLRVERLYAYLAVDPDDNNEGLVGFLNGDQQWIAMVGADMEMMEKLKPMAREMVEAGQEVRLCVFTQREDLDF